MKQYFLLAGLLSITLGFTACETKTETVASATENKVATLSMRATADSIVQIFKRNDLLALKPYIYGKSTVLFSPYSVVDTAKALRMSANDFNTFFTDERPFDWGTYDGSGLPIHLSSTDYYKQFVYNKPFAEADSVIENKSIQRGNSLDNLAAAFPGTEHVEYFVAGDPKQAGLGWGSLTLVLKEREGVWYLVGVVNNRWTI